MKRMETTLILLKKEDKILLGRKKRGFGAGKYNGVGGKIEPGETIEEGMIRETQEEINVTPTKYEKMGEVEFIEFFKGKKLNVIFHLFLCTEWEGTISESEEMDPKWFKVDQLPYDLMFEDDSYWMPYVLEGKKIKAFFEFDENWKMLSYDIKELEECFV